MSSPRPLESLQDGELMSLIVARDQRAFSEFYRRHASGLFGMIYQILNEQKEAEDALQDTLVQIWKKADTYDAGRSSLFTWAVMIGRHRALDRLRARERRRKADQAIQEEFAKMPTSDRGAVGLPAELKDERDRVRGALLSLPQEQREAIECAFFAGLTHEQVSNKLSAPLGTIKARIRRGLLALREALS